PSQGQLIQRGWQRHRRRGTSMNGATCCRRPVRRGLCPRARATWLFLRFQCGRQCRDRIDKRVSRRWTPCRGLPAPPRPRPACDEGTYQGTEAVCRQIFTGAKIASKRCFFLDLPPFSVYPFTCLCLSVV